MLRLKTTDNNCSKKITGLIKKSSRAEDSEAFSAAHYSSLSRIANVPLKELSRNLLVFPYEIDKSYGAISELPIFEMCGCLENLSEVKIKTGNLIP